MIFWIICIYCIIASFVLCFAPYRIRQSPANCKIPASPYSVQHNIQSIPNGGVVNGTAATPTKHSMLDKLKLFNKEKSDRSSKTQISKRTSSSSGFSSARSERSDSSLSLNDGQTLPAKTGSLKKPECNGSKTKSKLLSSSKGGSKDALNNKKSDKNEKKDKSPARGDSQPPVDSKIVPPKIQKASSKAESKLKMVSAPKKLEARSESKTSLSSIPGPKAVGPAAGVGIGTGIPKPMAAIKGTTKPPVYQQALKQEHHYDIKTDKTGSDISNANISNQETKLRIVAPLLMDVSNNGGPIMVHHHQQLINSNISMSDSSHSKSTHSSSTGMHSNSSESSIIYRPSSESGSDIMHMRNGAMSPTNRTICPNPGRKIDRFTESGIVKENCIPGHIHHQGIHNGPPGVSNATGNKFNTVPTKMINSSHGVLNRLNGILHSSKGIYTN